ncbi:MAG: prepilin-type N-terminal cleavage/methylation domain-containing protein [Acidobacteria bacterium]|nr:prepilin-type N-terminal cleavage/methylation domain-containing protein [Acidobacteriota bacterium]
MSSRGVTLIEMLLVVTLIGLLVGVSFPAVSSGVDSIRLLSGADAVASFLNGALNRAERRQQVMEVSFDKQAGMLALRSAEPGFVRELNLPSGVAIAAIEPEAAHIFLYPGGAVPRIAVTLRNARGAEKTVRVDPMTGVPQIQ